MSTKNNMRTKNKAVAKTFTSEEAKSIVLDIFREQSDPEEIFKEIARNLLPQLISGTPKESERAKEWIFGRSEEAVMTMGLTHHYHLIGTVDKSYAALVLSMVRQIEKEYDCKTAIEKMLAEQITMAHIKVVAHSAVYQDWLGIVGKQGTGIEAHELEALSRQIDRAQRQFLSSLTALRQLKQPQMEVKIVARNAFVAQNQQVNTVPRP